MAVRAYIIPLSISQTIWYNSCKTLDVVDQENLFLLGESQGGCAVAITAPSHRDDVRAMVQYYPAFCTPDDARKRFPSVSEIPDTYKAFNRKVGRVYAEKLLDFDVWQEIAPYDRPDLIIHGNADKTESWIMDILEFIKSRRSTRRFTAKEVEAEKLDQILEAGRYAPSGGNSQSTHFLVIQNEDVLTFLQNAVQKAFAAMEEYPGMYRSMVNSIRAAKKGTYVFHYHAPVLILCANRKDYGNNIADVACALENMMLMANALDLGSCWINQLKWLNEDPEINDYLV